MFNWIRKYFMQEEVSAKEESIPVVVEPVKKDISEPIISFVETVKNNRKRFKVSRSLPSTVFNIRGNSEIITNYSIKDNMTEEVYTLESLEVYKYQYYATTVFTVTHKLTSTDIQWCTQDELQYVITELSEFYSGLALRKYKRHEQIRSRRIRDMDILKDKERSRLMGIYCEEKANEN